MKWSWGKKKNALSGASRRKGVGLPMLFLPEEISPVPADWKSFIKPSRICQGNLPPLSIRRMSRTVCRLSEKAVICRAAGILPEWQKCSWDICLRACWMLVFWGSSPSHFAILKYTPARWYLGSLSLWVCWRRAEEVILEDARYFSPVTILWDWQLYPYKVPPLPRPLPPDSPLKSSGTSKPGVMDTAAFKQ